MKKFLTGCFFCYAFSAFSQDTAGAYMLPRAEIKSSVPNIRVPLSEASIDKQALAVQPPYNILPAINTIPGVRMEERSPGSYRLSVRGSLLRSPFGIRNIKIYLDDFPFTDAGGNTYLNSLDASSLDGIKIIKGPQASIFGASTGGALLIDPMVYSQDSSSASVMLSSGSYGLMHESVSAQKRWKRFDLGFKQAWFRSDGYREQSAMQRHFGQLSGTWHYTGTAKLKMLFLLSDLQYQTPGALTLAQFNENPAQARPATASLPGAASQDAGVSNNTVFGGLSNEVQLTGSVKWLCAVSASGTAFKNPFITNYEERNENNMAFRTYIESVKLYAGGRQLRFQFGGEGQVTASDVRNYGNASGEKDTMQASDKLGAMQGFVFARTVADLSPRLLAEASLSFCAFAYRYRNVYPFADAAYRHTAMNPQLMPRLALLYSVTPSVSWRASVSRGYSAPTLAEIRASDNVINTNLQPETAYSYESGLRIRSIARDMLLDVSVFYFRLQDAIVRRVNANGTESFVNAGGTDQPGAELQFSTRLLKAGRYKLLKGMQLKTSAAYNRFTFSSYMQAGQDYSGKQLTGVPPHTLMAGINTLLPYNLSVYIQYYYAAELPLNDANTDYASEYHLLQLKAEWQYRKLRLFAGADNLLNQRYSLGNDLNAAGGRYYNAAAPRNYYAGLKIEL